MDREFWLEAFGYLGTVLVIISMMMTSMLKFRIINISGGTISTVYAILRSTWPVAIMNICLIVINTYHVIRELRHTSVYDRIEVGCDDRSLEYFIKSNLSDINKYFPNFDGHLGDANVICLIYADGCAAGVFIARREGDDLFVYADYTTPKYRDYKVAKYLFPELKSDGFLRVFERPGVKAHDRYLVKMGFEECDGMMVKKL